MDEVKTFKQEGGQPSEDQFNRWRREENDKIVVKGVTPIMVGDSLQLTVWYLRKEVHTGGFPAK